MKSEIAGIIIISLLLFACKSDNSKSYKTSDISLATKHSGEPNVFVSQEGKAYLSWVEYENDSLDVLNFSVLSDNAWSMPKRISSGVDWFINWADFPAFVAINQKQMSAHWLQKSDQGTYDYDVRITTSNDGGDTWSPSIIPHKDGIAAEHGFVSLLSTLEGNTLAVWLDGRNTKKEENNAMTLRVAEITPIGEIINEHELDDRVCDCCQTGATMTSRGPIVVYRDRTLDEIRDIGIVRMVNGSWTAPKSLHEDNWKIAGCPVNGPAIDSNGKFVSVAWYTMNDEEPKVFFCRSDDYGENFGSPIRIDDSNPLGRVDLVQTEDGNAFVTWMETHDSIALIKFKEIDQQNKSSESLTIAKNGGEGSSGFPRMGLVGNKEIVMAWTDTQDSIFKVKSIKIHLNNE